MHVIDSHTGGMPTRVIPQGGPDLGSGPLDVRAAKLAKEHEAFYKSVMLEPRGQPGMVGALLVEPVDPDCVTGVIYFDAEAVLGMCGHGTIGLAVTLHHMGRIGIGTHKFETPAGVVTVELHDANTVSVTNIESRLITAGAEVTLPSGSVVGDVAYGGNWFFIVDPSPLPVTTTNIPALTELAVSMRQVCNANGIGGPEGQPIDHVILRSPNPDTGAHSRNFVLCPDDEYDRSPCGTGSSAYMACLAARKRLGPGDEIVLESVIGSSYRVSYQPTQNGVIPTLTGQAWIMNEGTLFFDTTDPFKDGIYL
ncbi:4-hydroxyproline epimerase [Halocynthiibacter styelae]|uniref:Proline racemase family protein n=1 Tax=Halocynthiibacter styelae TaxID=2761955 RepID=A0A8J7IQ08_9RHOB|nr:proline racemase family protein [Paenihalocynthiibacter styelae]MBI1495031.1 proline racemase family protein [Paenihalocynthiibacter styelae]